MAEELFSGYNLNLTPLSYSFPAGSNYSNYTLDDFKTLNTASILSITVYSVLLFFGLLGNLVVFLTLLKSRYRKSSRVNKLILHLAIADLIVCCFTIPIEIGWRITITWDAGDAACRILQFSRPFGLYLSSNTIICISLDRYFAIVQPLKLADARRRTHMMLFCAWLFAVISSIPQAIIFRATSGEIPELPNVTISDCLSTDYFENPIHEAVYNIFSISIMYVIPLVITVSAYGRILWEISITRRLKATNQQNNHGSSQNSLRTPGPENPAPKVATTPTAIISPTPLSVAADPRTNCNNINNPSLRNARKQVVYRAQTDLTKIQQARSRTLKLTILIVSVFIVCFTPYAVMVFWYQIDRDSALHIDQTVQEALFLFAVSNSILNPYLYGIYSKNLRKEVSRSFLCRGLSSCFQAKNPYGGSSSHTGTHNRRDKIATVNRLRYPNNGNFATGADEGLPLRWTPPRTPPSVCKFGSRAPPGPARNAFDFHSPSQSDVPPGCCQEFLRTGVNGLHQPAPSGVSRSMSSQKSLVSQRSPSSITARAGTQRLTAACKKKLPQLRPKKNLELRPSSFD